MLPQRDIDALSGVYSDTTQLNSTDPVEQRTAKSVVFLFMASRPTNWVNLVTTFIDRWQLNWVELCRYKHPLNHLSAEPGSQGLLSLLCALQLGLKNERRRLKLIFLA